MDHILILAGGRGKRMGENFPKALTEIAGEPMIFRLLENMKNICEKPTLIVGFGAEEIMVKVGDLAEYVFQSEQLGTGNAVACARKKLEQENFDNIVILPGDHPLISGKTVEKMIASHKNSGAIMTVSSVRVSEFAGHEEVFYNCGRLIMDASAGIVDIVELKDASDEQKEIKDVNVSYYCFNAGWLWTNIDGLKNDNSAGEYYLTDLIGIAVAQKRKINNFCIERVIEGMGINTPEQKRLIEAILKEQS